MATDPRTARLDKMWEMKRAKPTSDIEALMMAAPGEDVEPSSNPLAEAVASVMDEFTPDEQELLTLSLVGGLAVREIAAALGLSKSEAHRRLSKLTPRLTEALKANPEIKEYLDV